MRRIITLSASLLFAIAVSACDEQPTTVDSQAPVTPETELSARHGQSSTAEASVVYLSVDTEAAEKNGFDRAGEKVGTLSVTDDGAELTVTGEAEGLNPNDDDRYISLFYDKASPAQGPHACEPGVGEGHPLFITAAQMIIGPGTNTVFPPPFGAPHEAWDVDSDGDATFGPSGTLEYVPLDMIGTVSIRDLTVSDADLNGDETLDPGAGPEAVVACGVVTHAPASPSE